MSQPTVFLIAEDEDSRPYLRSWLKEKGYRVSIAIDEEDAFDRVRHQHLKADLLVMNFVRESAEDVLQIGRSICRAGEIDAPIIVIANNYEADLEGRDIKTGEREYITYLADGDQLLSLIAFVLEGFSETVIT